jgi:hypothetical protein
MSDLQSPLFRYLLYTAYVRAIDYCVFMDFNHSVVLNLFYLVSTRTVIFNNNSFFLYRQVVCVSQSMYFEIHNRV